MVLIDAAIPVSLLVMLLSWMAGPIRIDYGPLHLQVSWGLRPALAPLVLLVVRLALRAWAARLTTPPAGLWPHAWFRGITTSIVATILFFGAFELALKALHFQNVVPPIVFEGKDDHMGWKRSGTIPDAELLYVLEPGSIFQGRPINRMGFREREVSIQKPAGTRRVICMGDSCTAQGAPGYAQYLHERLNQAPPTAEAWEAFNMATHGYSSVQGLRMFSRWADRIAPDYVTLYYGWNDHWLSAATDRDQMAIKVSPIRGRLYDRLSRRRFFQFLNWLAGHSVTAATSYQERMLRVPPEDYRATLTEFVQRVRAAGAVPILITAPHGRMSSQEVRKSYVHSIEDGLRKHAKYVEITREVAAATGADLLDLAQILDGEEHLSLFARDGIHFDQYARESHLTNGLPPDAQPGLRRVADELYLKIQSIAATPP
jgi:lysophospholipase L1-like esterase